MLALIRDKYLNLWDVGNYYGLTKIGVELLICGKNIDNWESFAKLYPDAKLLNYNTFGNIIDKSPTVIDLPDAHYYFTQEMVRRHDRAVVVGWDNLPGKNLFDREALYALDDAWKVVARSNMALSCLTKFDHVDARKVFKIPGAVDTEFFSPGKDENRRNVILFVGRITPEKGIVPLIWAMENTGMELWIVGNEGKSNYKNIVREWGLRCGIIVEFLGFYSRPKLAKAMKEVKILALPSLPKLTDDVYSSWLEQFGQILIEGMASGLPILATDSPAIKEVVGKAGWYSSPLDWMGMHDNIKDAQGDNWHKKSSQARKRAVKNYDQIAVAKTIKKVYEL